MSKIWVGVQWKCVFNDGWFYPTPTLNCICIQNMQNKWEVCNEYSSNFHQQLNPPQRLNSDHTLKIQ
jgi:hypothetical protein